MLRARLTPLLLALSLVACSTAGEHETALPGDAEREARHSARGCDRGDAYACHNLAVSWRDGAEGLHPDEDRALQLFLHACDEDASTACRHAARILDRRDQPEQARQLLRKACDLLDAFACTDLALLIAQGRGGPADPVLSFSMMESACARRVPTACMESAHALLDPDHPAHDEHRGRLLLGHNCQNGLMEACAAAGALLVRDLRASRQSGHPPSAPLDPDDDRSPELTLDPARATPRTAEVLLRRGCLGRVGQACADLAELLRTGDLLPVDEERAARLEQMAREAPR
ncbi:MAG: sel1 repeat family protein [Deltaproteobacteria bacterium]|nr:MAG: sel1 repeat family protein [Deltaproteobacteria bacterium]